MSVDSSISDDLPVIDESRLIAEFGDDPDVLAELRDLFLEHIPPLARDIRLAVESGDALALARHAHSLKGACSTYGAPRLMAVCKKLEDLGKADDVTGATAVLGDFEAEYKRVVQQLGAITVP